MITGGDEFESFCTGFFFGGFAGIAILILRITQTMMALSKKIMTEGVDTKATITGKFTKMKPAGKRGMRDANMVSYTFYAVKDGKQVLVTMPETEFPDSETYPGLILNGEVDVKYLASDPLVHELVPSLNFILKGQVNGLAYLVALIFGCAGFGMPFLKILTIALENMGFMKSFSAITPWTAGVVFLGGWLISTITVPCCCRRRMQDILHDSAASAEDVPEGDSAAEPLILEAKIVPDPSQRVLQATIVENQATNSATNTVVEGQATIVAVEDMKTKEPTTDNKMFLMCCGRGVVQP